MSLFKCEKCGCIENTAVSNYVINFYKKKPILCSECDPEIGKWHGEFEKRSAIGMILDSDGFLHTKEEINSESFQFRLKNQNLKIIGEIK